jgi:hypothetical protein
MEGCACRPAWARTLDKLSRIDNANLNREEIMKVGFVSPKTDF